MLAGRHGLGFHGPGAAVVKLSPETIAALHGPARRRAIEAAGRERAAAERRAVESGVDETVALGEARGETFTRSTGTRAVRRQTGLEFLANARKLSGERIKHASRYAYAWAAAHAAPPLRSVLCDTVRGGEGPSIEQIGANGAARVSAQNYLFGVAVILGHQRDLLGALSVILGEGKTPREAGGNALGAAVYTSNVLIALDLLAAHAAALNARPIAA